MPPISSASKCGPAISRKPSTASRSASAGSSGRGADIDMATVGSSRGETLPCRRSPVFDMIEHRLSTRSGWSIVSCWAIIPPIDTPTTCAAPTPRWSSSADGVGGHVGQQVVGAGVAPVGEALEQRRPGRRRPLGLRRQPDVAVVHPDDAEAAVGEPARRRRPARPRAGRPGPSRGASVRRRPARPLRTRSSRHRAAHWSWAQSRTRRTRARRRPARGLGLAA